MLSTATTTNIHTYANTKRTYHFIFHLCPCLDSHAQFIMVTVCDICGYVMSHDMIKCVAT